MQTASEKNCKKSDSDSGLGLAHQLERETIHNEKEAEAKANEIKQTMGRECMG